MKKFYQSKVVQCENILNLSLKFSKLFQTNINIEKSQQCPSNNSINLVNYEEFNFLENKFDQFKILFNEINHLRNKISKNELNLFSICKFTSLNNNYHKYQFNNKLNQSAVFNKSIELKNIYISLIRDFNQTIQNDLSKLSFNHDKIYLLITKLDNSLFYLHKPFDHLLNTNFPSMSSNILTKRPFQSHFPFYNFNSILINDPRSDEIKNDFLNKKFEIKKIKADQCIQTTTVPQELEISNNKSNQYIYCQTPKSRNFIQSNLISSNLFEFDTNHHRVYKSEYNLLKKQNELLFDEFISQEIEIINENKNEMINIDNLPNLEKIILRVLFNYEISFDELQKLEKFELEILKTILVEKKIIQQNEKLKNLKNPEVIKQKKTHKRVEENLKFMIKKCFRFLKSKFIEKFGSSLNPYLKIKYLNQDNNQDYAFYGFYFDEAVSKLNICIEKVFEPGYYKKSNQNEIIFHLYPKTISKIYFRNVKLSPLFMKHLHLFMNKVVKIQTMSSIKIKLLNILSDQRKALSKPKSKRSLKRIQKLSKFETRCRIGWSIKEIEYAIEETFKYLKD